MRFKYRYLIYKIYSWKDDTPIGNTILTLGIVHFFHLLTILMIVDRTIMPIKGLWKINPGYLFIGMIIYFFLFYLLIYNKKKWATYVQEYKNESASDRRKGNVFVIFFLVGSILLFFISLPVLFSLIKKH